MDRYVFEIIERFGPYYNPQCRVRKIWWYDVGTMEQLYCPHLPIERNEYKGHIEPGLFHRETLEDWSWFRIIPITIHELLTHQRNDFRLIGQTLLKQDGARS